MGRREDRQEGEREERRAADFKGGLRDGPRPTAKTPQAWMPQRARHTWIRGSHPDHPPTPGGRPGFSSLSGGMMCRASPPRTHSGASDRTARGELLLHGASSSCTGLRVASLPTGSPASGKTSHPMPDGPQALGDQTLPGALGSCSNPKGPAGSGGGREAFRSGFLSTGA